MGKFLDEARGKHRISPQLSSEIFLRGILRTLWDIDRLLRTANPGDELKQFTKSSPLVLSILRVMVYEFMWLPKSSVRVAQRNVAVLMEKCGSLEKADSDFITDAVSRMKRNFEKTHRDLDAKRKAREEKKAQQQEDKDNG